MEQKKTIDSWEGHLTNYLKADHLDGDQDDFVCIGATVDDHDNLNLELERKDEKFVFTLNITNKSFLKYHGVEIPRKAIGKILGLIKVKAFSPTAKKEVDSLRINSIK